MSPYTIPVTGGNSCRVTVGDLNIDLALPHKLPSDDARIDGRSGCQGVANRGTAILNMLQQLLCSIRP
jgi:hypothetical protein